MLISGVTGEKNLVWHLPMKDTELRTSWFCCRLQIAESVDHSIKLRAASVPQQLPLRWSSLPSYLSFWCSVLPAPVRIPADFSKMVFNYFGLWWKWYACVCRDHWRHDRVLHPGWDSDFICCRPHSFVLQTESKANWVVFITNKKNSFNILNSFYGFLFLKNRVVFFYPL